MLTRRYRETSAATRVCNLTPDRYINTKLLTQYVKVTRLVLFRQTTSKTFKADYSSDNIFETLCFKIVLKIVENKEK